MYLCYLDESGSPELSGNTEHFVYAGIAIPAETWKEKDLEIYAIKTRYQLENAEIHTGWMLRNYFEQLNIDDFEALDFAARVSAAKQERVQYLNKLHVEGKHKLKKDKEKYFSKTAKYLHLTYDERCAFLHEIADCVSRWEDSRVFFHSIKKSAYDPAASLTGGMYEDAFQQVISRFQQFLLHKGTKDEGRLAGLLISDNNYTVNARLTRLARRFHRDGTFWNDIDNIVENPLFVDSVLTSMVQLADLVAYSIRRYFDNNEDILFNKILPRVDRVRRTYVGGRHEAPGVGCECIICTNRKANDGSRRRRRRRKRR